MRTVAVLLVVAGVVGCSEDKSTCIPGPWTATQFLIMDGGVRASFEKSGAIDVTNENRRILKGAPCVPLCQYSDISMDTRVKECRANPTAPFPNGDSPMYPVQCRVGCE
jgi:hypothetical protein